MRKKAEEKRLEKAWENYDKRMELVSQRQALGERVKLPQLPKKYREVRGLRRYTNKNCPQWNKHVDRDLNVAIRNIFQRYWADQSGEELPAHISQNQEITSFQSLESASSCLTKPNELAQ